MFFIVNNQKLHIHTEGNTLHQRRIVWYVVNKGQTKTNRTSACMFAKNDTETTNTRYVPKQILTVKSVGAASVQKKWQQNKKKFYWI